MSAMSTSSAKEESIPASPDPPKREEQTQEVGITFYKVHLNLPLSTTSQFLLSSQW